MREDLRQAKDAVMRLNAKGEKEYYIDKCDLTSLQAEILKRKFSKHQSLVQISMEMHLSKECIQHHYRNAMLILHDILQRCGK
jgi:hypothetical protein